jgi:hypothetical protein
LYLFFQFTLFVLFIQFTLFLFFCSYCQFTLFLCSYFKFTLFLYLYFQFTPFLCPYNSSISFFMIISLAHFKSFFCILVHTVDHTFSVFPTLPTSLNSLTFYSFFLRFPPVKNQFFIVFFGHVFYILSSNLSLITTFLKFMEKCVPTVGYENF